MNSTVLSSMVDTGYLMRMFRRSDQTIHIWRKRKNLPFIVIPGAGRPAIRYDRQEVMEWAKSNKMRIYPVIGGNGDGSG